MELDGTLHEYEGERYASDSKLFVVFYMKATKMGFKSEQAGRPIFEDVAHVKIHTPGNNTTVIDCPVTDEHRMRFAAQWEKFQKGLSQAPEGTPLEQWPQLTVSQVAEFKAVNIMTVEHVAELSDANVQKFMGGIELRKRAQTFLKVAKDTAESQRLAVENEELKGQVASLTEQVSRLAGQVELLLAKDNDAPPARPMKGQTSGSANRSSAGAGSTG